MRRSADARRALAAAGYGQVRVVARDGAEGLAAASPFDRILVTVGCPDLSPRWQEQLAEGGRLVGPLEHAELHPVVSLVRRGERLEGRFVCWSAFIPIRGVLHQRLAWPDAVLREREHEEIDGPVGVRNSDHPCDLRLRQSWPPARDGPIAPSRWPRGAPARAECG